MIKVENLTKIYKSKKMGECVALDDISFTLPDTGMVFVIGKSGSGKSTLLNLIGGLDDITKGSIIADGIDVKKMKNKDFDRYSSSYLSFIFQDYKLFEGLTVKENVQVGLDITNSYNEKIVLDAIKKVGLEGYEKRYPFELSGGEQQRVAIARSLVKDSRLILADEPTGNLDARTTKQVLDILKEVSNERLVVIVSHNLGDADVYADRIIELHEGKILSDKTKNKNYLNEYKVENNKAYLPHYYDLNDNDVDDLYARIKNGKVDEVIQVDNGFSDTKNIVYKSKEFNVKPKKATNRSLFKLFKMFLRKRMSTRILTIIFSVLIFVVLYIIQSFVMFNPNPTDVVFDDDYIVLHKGDNVPLDTSMRTGELYSIVDSDIDKLLETGYDDDYYLLSNYTYGSSNSLQNYSYGLHNKETNFYFNKFTGTLKCDYDFLVDLFGVNGKLNVLAGDLYDKPYGLIITDYMADALIEYNSATSYNSIIGEYKFAYVNAIIDTNYEEEFKDIKKIYDDFDNYESVEKFVNVVINHPDYERYSQLISRYYSISYSFNKNLEQDLLDSGIVDVFYANFLFSWNNVEFGGADSSSAYKSFYNNSYRTYQKLNIKPGQLYLNVDLYNELFGTAYTKENYSLEVNNRIIITLKNKVNGEDVITYQKEFEIIGLGNTIFNEQDFKEVVSMQITDYGIYFENNEYAKELIKVGEDLDFYLWSIDFDSGLMIIKMTSAFESLFLIILIIVYVVLFGYIIYSGVNVVKQNKEDIGIYKSLGGKFINIGKVLLLDIVLTGICIIVLATIFTPIILTIADSILVLSFENVLNINIYHMNIIKIFPGILTINFSSLFMAINLSGIVPAVWLVTLKPIKIIKE